MSGVSVTECDFYTPLSYSDMYIRTCIHTTYVVSNGLPTLSINRFTYVYCNLANKYQFSLWDLKGGRHAKKVFLIHASNG